MHTCLQELTNVSAVALQRGADHSGNGFALPHEFMIALGRCDITPPNSIIWCKCWPQEIARIEQPYLSFENLLIFIPVGHQRQQLGLLSQANENAIPLHLF